MAKERDSVPTKTELASVGEIDWATLHKCSGLLAELDYLRTRFPLARRKRSDCYETEAIRRLHRMAKAKGHRPSKRSILKPLRLSDSAVHYAAVKQ